MKKRLLSLLCALSVASTLFGCVFSVSAEPQTYTPKTVYMRLVSESAGVEGGYFCLPDDTVVYTGDSVRLVYSGSLKFTWPNGSTGTMWNVTPKKGSWSDSKQPPNGGVFVFNTPGTYSLYNTDNGVKLTTFEVVDSKYAPIDEDDPGETADSLYPDGSVSPWSDVPTGDDATLLDTGTSGTYFTSDIWQAVPLISQELIDLGYSGGESCQVINSLEVDERDGKLCLFGTDVGGLYKSTDGGTNWYMSSIGLKSAGATGIKIDPTNSNRVMLVGANSGYSDYNGLYLSTDAGDTWNYVYTVAQMGGSIGIHGDRRTQQIAYDETSYSKSIGGCAVVYWSREYNTKNPDYNMPGIYKSTNGGETWSLLPNTYDIGGGTIFVNSENGYVFASSRNGIYRSKDGGSSWTKIFSDDFTSMDVVRTAPGCIYVAGAGGLYTSTDNGDSFTCRNGNQYPSVNPTSLQVSPDDRNYMIVQSITGTYTGNTYYTTDAGKTWSKSSIDFTGLWPETNGFTKEVFQWSPVHKRTVLRSTWGGIYKSIDSGKTFHWNNAGYNGICAGGKFNFNVNNPNLIMIASQDFNGGYSTDGGKTWKYLKWAGASWGGWTYGGYALTEDTVIAGVADAMYGANNYIWTTFDGGKTFNNTGLKIDGSYVAIGALGSDEIVMFGEWRTVDGGHTWEKMEANNITGSYGCNGVFTIDYKTGRLFGKNGTTLVTSIDNGETWQKIGTTFVNYSVSDMAYNSATGTLYYIGGGACYYSHIDFSETENKFSYLRIQELSGEAGNISTICIDPNNPQIMYIGRSSTSVYNLTATWRSLDYGKTWTCLTRSADDGRTGPDGGRQPMCMRVNPLTGEMMTTTGCKGIWKMASPPQWYIDQNYIKPETVPSEYTPPETVMSKQVSDDLTSLSLKYGRDLTDLSNPGIKTVSLKVSYNAGEEYKYFSVPENTKIYVGDTVKLDYSSYTSFTWPDGSKGQMWNVTTKKGSWSDSKQPQNGGTFTFNTPGDYTFYNTDKNIALITFHVYPRPEKSAEISTKQELSNIRSNTGGIYILTADIEFTAADFAEGGEFYNNGSGWQPIGSEGDPFIGILYGNGHTITGLQTSGKGLFDTLGGIVYGLGVIDFDVNGSGSGAIAGTVTQSGAIDNCYVDNCSVSGTKSGGIAGTNNGCICYCYITGKVSGNGSGAIAGVNNGLYAGCYYSTGSASSAIGSGTTEECEAVACTAAQMVQKSTYTYFDFDYTWSASSGKKPVLVGSKASTADAVTFDKQTVFMQKGDTDKLNIIYSPNSDVYTRIAYFTGDKNVVTVDNNGNLKAVGFGKTTVKAIDYAGELAAYCEVTVGDCAISSDVLTVLDGYVYLNNTGMTVKSVASMMNNGDMLTFAGVDGTELNSDDTVATGCIIKLVSDGKTFDTVRAVLYGDINGDGSVSSSDMLLIQQHMLGAKELSGASLKACNVDKTGGVDTSDLLVLQHHMLGISNIFR